MLILCPVVCTISHQILCDTKEIKFYCLYQFNNKLKEMLQTQTCLSGPTTSDIMDQEYLRPLLKFPYCYSPIQMHKQSIHTKTVPQLLQACSPFAFPEMSQRPLYFGKIPLIFIENVHGCCDFDGGQTDLLDICWVIYQ